MLSNILASVINWIEHVVTTSGPLGITFLMAIESCNVPLPSEAILPFAGYLVSKNVMNYHVVSFAGAIGCVIGSIPSYYLGYYGGRKFLEKYGKYLLVSRKELAEADKLVEKYGVWAFFICRMLPIVRTFISFPAGILKANKLTFFSFTFLGSLIWSYALVYVGIKLGQHSTVLKALWEKFDVAIIIVFGGLFVWYIYRHVKQIREENNNPQD